jgi:hypothetical protein
MTSPPRRGFHDFHGRDAEQVAIGGVDRNDRKIGSQCIGAIGALGDRQAQKHAVGEKRHEPDGHAVGPWPPKRNRAPRSPRTKFNVDPV